MKEMFQAIAENPWSAIFAALCITLWLGILSSMVARAKGPQEASVRLKIEVDGPVLRRDVDKLN